MSPIVTPYFFETKILWKSSLLFSTNFIHCLGKIECGEKCTRVFWTFSSLQMNRVIKEWVVKSWSTHHCPNTCNPIFTPSLQRSHLNEGYLYDIGYGQSVEGDCVITVVWNMSERLICLKIFKHSLFIFNSINGSKLSQS